MTVYFFFFSFNVHRYLIRFLVQYSFLGPDSGSLWWTAGIYEFIRLFRWLSLTASGPQRETLLSGMINQYSHQKHIEMFHFLISFKTTLQIQWQIRISIFNENFDIITKCSYKLSFPSNVSMIWHDVESVNSWHSVIRAEEWKALSAVYTLL